MRKKRQSIELLLNVESRKRNDPENIGYNYEYMAEVISKLLKKLG